MESNVSTETHNPSNPEPYMWPPDADKAGREDAHKQVCDWLRANGINPADLPANPRASLVDGQLTFLRKVRSPEGRDVLTPDRTEVMTETVTAPITVPPPWLVELWLAPKRPSCGR